MVCQQQRRQYRDGQRRQGKQKNRLALCRDFLQGVKIPCLADNAKPVDRKSAHQKGRTPGCAACNRYRFTDIFRNGNAGFIGEKQVALGILQIHYRVVSQPDGIQGVAQIIAVDIYADNAQRLLPVLFIINQMGNPHAGAVLCIVVIPYKLPLRVQHRLQPFFGNRFGIVCAKQLLFCIQAINFRIEGREKPRQAFAGLPCRLDLLFLVLPRGIVLPQGFLHGGVGAKLQGQVARIPKNRCQLRRAGVH